MNLVLVVFVIRWWSQNQFQSLSAKFCVGCIWHVPLSASFSMPLCSTDPFSYQSKISPLWFLIEWWVLHIRCMETSSRRFYTLWVMHCSYWGLHSFQQDTHIRAFFHPDQDLFFFSTESRHHGIHLATHCIQSPQSSFHHLLYKLQLGLVDLCFFDPINRQFPWNNLPSSKHFLFHHPWFSAGMSLNCWKLQAKSN